MTTTTTTAPPSDYRLAVPDGWFRIALDPALWEKRIEALVDRCFKGNDSAPVQKRQLREQVVEQAARAYATGGLELYLSLLAVEGVPVPSSLVVTYVPAPPGGHPALDKLAESFVDGESGIVYMPAADAVRHRYAERPDDEKMGAGTMLVTHLDIHIPVPNIGSHLLLSFSTPMEPLADPLVELFDSIARTLKWVA